MVMPRRSGTNRQYLDLGLPAVCRRLEVARQRKGWTKRDMARAAGVDEKAASKLLDPATFAEPQLRTAAGVVRALGLTLDGLFGLPANSARIPPGEDALAWLLAERGWSMSQLAIEAGLTPAAVAAMLAGKNRPDLLSAIAIARAGGVSLDSLAAALSNSAADRTSGTKTHRDRNVTPTKKRRRLTMTRKSVAFAIGFALLPFSAQAQSWPAPPSLYGNPYTVPTWNQPIPASPYGGGLYTTPSPDLPRLFNGGGRPCVPAAGDRC